MLAALTRPVPSSINRCELTHLDRSPIDLAVARKQHEAYEEALSNAGCTIVRLAPEDELPDSVFVEDAAIVLDEIAVITRPGAESRRPETVSVAAAMREYRQLRFLEAPAILDGGDVLRVGRTIFRRSVEEDEWRGLSSTVRGSQATRLLSSRSDAARMPASQVRGDVIL